MQASDALGVARRVLMNRVGPPSADAPDGAAIIDDRATRVIRVLIVDDHDLVRAGMRSILSQADGILVVGEMHRRRAGAVGDRCGHSRRRVDGSADPGDEWSGSDPGPADHLSNNEVLMMSVAGTDCVILEAAAAGAVGCVIKNGNSRHLISAIRAVATGAPAWPLRRG